MATGAPKPTRSDIFLWSPLGFGEGWQAPQEQKHLEGGSFIAACTPLSLLHPTRSARGCMIPQHRQGARSSHCPVPWLSQCFPWDATASMPTVGESPALLEEGLGKSSQFWKANGVGLSHSGPGSPAAALGQHLHHPSPSRHIDELLSVQSDAVPSAESAQN